VQFALVYVVFVITVALSHKHRGRRVKRGKERVSVCVCKRERVMKRQSSAVSPSSSRRETPPEKLHAKTIGCMSGILHFISNSNARRSRRFLTFGAFRFAFLRAHTISVSFLSRKILVTQYSFLLSFSQERGRLIRIPFAQPPKIRLRKMRRTPPATGSCRAKFRGARRCRLRFAAPM